jgi:hypothetical protein
MSALLYYYYYRVFYNCTKARRAEATRRDLEISVPALAELGL